MEFDSLGQICISEPKPEVNLISGAVSKIKVQALAQPE